MTTNTPEPEVRACGRRTEAGDDGWCEETGMSYAMMDVIDDSLRMFLPWPFHERDDQQHSGRGPATGGDE